MQDSRLGVATWFAAAALVARADITPRALAERLGVSYTAALRMKRRLEEATARGGSDADLLQKLHVATAENTGGVPSPTPAQESASRTREHIRAAACRAFAARGQSGTRIADIAREAGVSSAIIHYYYRSKDEVLLAALQWADEQTVRRWESLRATTADPLRLLRETLGMAVPSEGVLRDEYLLWIETWARVRFHPSLLAECVSMSDRWAVFLTEVIEEGRRTGVFHPLIPTDELVQRLVAMSDGLAFRSAVGYANMRARRVNQMLLAFAAEQVGVPVEALSTP
jgi:AcrR family transcriptional regulator